MRGTPRCAGSRKSSLIRITATRRLTIGTSASFRHLLLFLLNFPIFCGWILNVWKGILFQLDKAVSFHDSLRPACLPPANTSLKAFQRCTIIGWGKTQEQTGEDEYSSLPFSFPIVLLLPPPMSHFPLPHASRFLRHRREIRGSHQRGRDPPGGLEYVPQLASGFQPRDGAYQEHVLRWLRGRWHRLLPGR